MLDPFLKIVLKNMYQTVLIALSGENLKWKAPAIKHWMSYFQGSFFIYTAWKNALIMRFLFIYLIGGIKGRKRTISLMCYTEKLMREHRQRWISGSWGFRPSISDEDHRSYWNKKKMPKERKDKKFQNKVSKTWLYLKNEERRKQLILLMSM